MKSSLKTSDLLYTLSTIRQNLHQIPELELELPETKAFLKELFAPVQARIIEMEDSDSFVLFFDFGQKDTLAFRSDMDALPVSEHTDHSFKSRHPGKMHACGHDGHMAILSAFALWLNENQPELPFNVALVFQAGEESPGGARLIVESELLKKLSVFAIFGLHLWPSLKPGIYTRPGAMMASSREITIVVRGISVHASRYREGVDAMEVAARVLLELYAMEEKLDPDQPRLLRFGSLHAGSACNVVSDEAVLYGTLRTYDLDFMDEIQQKIAGICEKLAAESKAEIEIRYSNGYPPLLNDAALANWAFEELEDLQLLEQPDLASEDFSYYTRHVPALFFFLGVDGRYPLHSDRFDFDEKHLLRGLQLYIDLLKAMKQKHLEPAL